MTTAHAESPSTAGNCLRPPLSSALIGEDFDAALSSDPGRVVSSDDDPWAAAMFGATAAEAVSRTWILLPRARSN